MIITTIDCYLFSFIAEKKLIKIIDNGLQSHGVHELLFQEYHFFVLNHELFRSNVAAFPDFHSNLDEVYLDYRIISKKQKES